MNVADGGSQEVDPRIDKSLRLLRCGQYAFHVAGILHARLAAIDPARFGLGADALGVAVGHQLLCLCQVLLLVIVAHVDHDAVELARLGRRVDLLGRLRVVEV